MKKKYLFNIACAEGDLKYVKENFKKFKVQEIEFGLAANHDRLEIVNYHALKRRGFSYRLY